MEKILDNACGETPSFGNFILPAIALLSGIRRGAHSPRLALRLDNWKRFDEDEH